MPDPICCDRTLRQSLERMERLHAVPRSPRLASRYIRDRLRKGRYCLMPAGLDTRALLSTIRETSGLSVAAVVDRNAEAIRSVSDIPAVRPDELTGIEFNRVLICHPIREAELAKDLKAAGLSDDRIELLYGNPEYLDFCRQEGGLNDVHGPLSGIRSVIVRAGRSGTIVGDDSLGGIFTPSQTVVLNVGLEAERIESSVFLTIDLYGSLAMLRCVLERLNPQTVYLQLNLHTVFLAALVRLILPKARLIYEMWDLWRSSIDDLKPEHHSCLLGMDDSLIDLNRRAETFVLASADGLVSKRGGCRWEEECRSFGAPYHQYFARIEPAHSAEPNEAPTAGPVRIIFAATLQLPSILAEFDYVRVNQDHRLVFEALAATGRVTVDIYNAGHRDGSHDASYADYLDRYRDGPIVYHRRIPADELRRIMSRHHYGWIRATPAVPSLDCDVVIPASLSTCISAGVPVIVHASLPYAADLVQRFEAGIVVPPNDSPEAAVQRIVRNADPLRHRQGALRLRAYMEDRNRDTLSAIGTLVEA